ncbi:hypothetical protein [Endozoicomonas sp. 8E]|uniref:hypothetical protein n=1 Tax=Endozoicomonas sp. 8E TaxID=3035692 RepID=UPI0029391025|nr:hypothetical protein [Endozoicomonas sp. 8E]WOG29041.1 hypothetical protein P6910_05090 [Endozoicomonas sp. 8E]
MQVFLFSLLLLFHLLQTSEAREMYTTVLWEYDLYSHAENKTIGVRLNSQIKFLCPNLPTVARARGHDRQTSDMKENIWLTDNETYYENCEIPEDCPISRQDIFICDDPIRLVHLNLLFLPDAAEMNDKTFGGGKYYYLFSTSNGRASSLYNRKGGHCLTHNMRIKIYVCKARGDTSPLCKKTNPQLNWLPGTYPFTPAPVTNRVKAHLTNPLTTTAPAITDHTDTGNNTETVMTNTTEKVAAVITDIYTDTVTTKATETVPTNYDDTQADSVQLMWEVGFNQTQTETLFEEENYPVVALCKEPDTKISLLNNQGRIVDSWLCQKVGDRLTILKPEYRNGDVYRFEASPEYSLSRVWKSKLSINVGSFNYEYLSKANALFNLPTFALLVSMYLITANVF